MKVLLLLATLTGRVVDSTNAVLPGVTVEAASQRTITGADGAYELTLPPGTYDVSFQLSGFATNVRRGVVVRENERSRADATLQLAASADVVVTAEPASRGLGASEGIVTAREIERRPFQRAGEILETVPGMIVSQHSGEGKANQYYLRGFNLDHGTDVAITVAGAPVNMPTHGHGQGYADANFLIPELIRNVQFEKGPYSADEGDFASAGAVDVDYLSVLGEPIAFLQAGSQGYRRALIAASSRAGGGSLLYAVEAGHDDGPWVRPDGYRKLNGVLRYTRGGFGITAMGYDAEWSSSDQIPQRAVDSGAIPRFGLVDPSAGGSTSRFSLAGDWQRKSSSTTTQASAYAIAYRLQLFSNFTYFLDDPVNGDQFEQADDRRVYGARVSHRRAAQWRGLAIDNVVGLQTRHDDIRNVGLYRTRERTRLDTVRQDRANETSAGVYGQSSVQWTPWLRTVAGLRADRYRFDVETAAGRDASIVSPKLTAILGPWRNTELYANAGTGFHSNDARGVTSDVDPATPLVRTRGAELGLRTTPARRLHMTAALWALDMASELLFVGDAGTTEASRPSRRTGVEMSVSYELRDWLALDADYAYSRARFRDGDPAGDRIPGAVEGVASAGLSVIDLHGISAELRYRYFGPRPLIEDDSMRSEASSLVNARIGLRVTPRVRFDVDVFNVFDAQASDVDYFYTSRLPGEPAGGRDDVHFHPVEKRAVRVGIATSF